MEDVEILKELGHGGYATYVIAWNYIASYS
jgi:hypothetical protein